MTLTQPFILFKIGDASYGVPAYQVQQVEMIERITRVPNAPEFIQGVVSIRGQVVPVVNVRRRFGLPEIAHDLRSRLIVTRLQDRTVGLLVDSAREFLRLDPDQIEPLPATLAGPGREFLSGVLSLPDRLVLMVNLPGLLSQEEKQVLSQPPPNSE